MTAIPTELEPTETKPRLLGGMAGQLVNSALETTRVFWRTKLGLSEEIINDPRPIKLIIKEN